MELYSKSMTSRSEVWTISKGEGITYTRGTPGGTHLLTGSLEPPTWSCPWAGLFALNLSSPQGVIGYFARSAAFAPPGSDGSKVTSPTGDHSPDRFGIGADAGDFGASNFLVV